MRAWLKIALQILLAFSVSWGGALWYWNATNRMPGAGDLILLLLALPVALLLVFWLGRKLVEVLAVAPPFPAATQSGPAAPPRPAPPKPLAILGAALRAPYGASPEELSAALAANKARADLDPELLDVDGFPVMTLRSGEADDARMQEAITEWLAQSGSAEPHFNGEQWRAVILGTAVVAELASGAAGDLIPMDGTAAPMLQLMPVLPAEWRIEERRAAGQWLRSVAIQSGWPEERISLTAELPLDARGSTPAAVLGRLAHHSMIGGAPLAAIVVACGSHLGEESVAKWSADSILFTSSCPQGLIPGEGAAGMLLADMHTARAVDGAAAVLLQIEAEARRQNWGNGEKKADAALLGGLTEKVLARGAVSASQVAMIVADTGHRTSRVLELMRLATAAMPQLDAGDEVLRVGAGCGTCGAVPFMMALAIASHHALERDAPVLCISNEDSYHRCAALVRPAETMS